MESNLVSNAKSSFKKRILAKPNNSKRQSWMSLIKNCVKSIDNTNIELTSLLEKIGEAEKIPVKWNRINKPKFMIFLSSIDGYQVNPKIDEQSWDLISKALMDERKNKAETNTRNGSKKHTATNKSIDEASGSKENKDVMSGKGDMKLKKESGPPVEETLRKKRHERNLAKKLARQNNAKNKLIDNAEWANMIQSLVQQVDVGNEELKNHLQRISHAPNIPLKAKWSSMCRPKFMTFLMNIPSYKVDPTIIDSLWPLIRKRLNENHRKSVNSMTSEKIKTMYEDGRSGDPKMWIWTWLSVRQNLIVNNKDEELTKGLQIIAKAGKIPKQLNKFSQKKFMTFLQTLPTYQVNPATDEKIWNLVCVVLEEHEKNMALKVDEVKQEDEFIETGSKRKASALNGNLFNGSKKVKMVA